MRAIWTIGHSSHEAEKFVSLLSANAVEFLIDVRSTPRSRIAPHFDRESLHPILQRAQIQYAFFGFELGGRPPEQELYDVNGRVLYWAVARLPRFQAAIDRLVNGSDSYRIAVMCSEEDPSACHRRLLVGRVLTQRGILLKHVRGDGRVEDEQAVELLTVGPLFGILPVEERDWKSSRSVLRGKVLNSSSNVSSPREHAH